jgi:hypothetical protein
VLECWSQESEVRSQKKELQELQEFRSCRIDGGIGLAPTAIGTNDIEPR